MAESSMKIQVKMTDYDMYRFLMYHNKTHLTGLLPLICGILTAVMCVYTAVGESYLYAAIFALITVLFLVFPSFFLKKKAHDQISEAPLFKKTFFFDLSSGGIRLYQGKSSKEISWDQIYKIVVTADGIYIYTDKNNAWIIPDHAAGIRRDKVINFMEAHVSAGKVKKKS